MAIVLHASSLCKENEKNSLEEDWLFQAILECYIPLLQVMEKSRKKDTNNTKLNLSLSPTLLSFKNKQIQKICIMDRNKNRIFARINSY